MVPVDPQAPPEGASTGTGQDHRDGIPAGVIALGRAATSAAARLANAQVTTIRTTLDIAADPGYSPRRTGYCRPSVRGEGHLIPEEQSWTHAKLRRLGDEGSSRQQQSP